MPTEELPGNRQVGEVVVRITVVGVIVILAAALLVALLLYALLAREKRNSPEDQQRGSD
jgi:hypothetical protein